MKELMEILETLRPDIDFDSADNLVTEGVLSSFDIVSLIASFGDKFDVEVTPEYLLPENFNNAKAMWAMIEDLQDE